jgi:hypothetical protein
MHARGGPGKDGLHNQSGTVLLQGHAIWIKECRGNILAVGEQDFPRVDRKEHGGIRRWYVSEEHTGDQTRQQLDRDIPVAEEVRYETKWSNYLSPTSTTAIVNMPPRTYTSTIREHSTTISVPLTPLPLVKFVKRLKYSNLKSKF